MIPDLNVTKWNKYVLERRIWNIQERARFNWKYKSEQIVTFSEHFCSVRHISRIYLYFLSRTRLFRFFFQNINLLCLDLK